MDNATKAPAADPFDGLPFYLEGAAAWLAQDGKWRLWRHETKALEAFDTREAAIEAYSSASRPKRRDRR